MSDSYSLLVIQSHVVEEEGKVLLCYQRRVLLGPALVSLALLPPASGPKVFERKI